MVFETLVGNPTHHYQRPAEGRGRTWILTVAMNALIFTHDVKLMPLGDREGYIYKPPPFTFTSDFSFP
jgi:hypothetical protein